MIVNLDLNKLHLENNLLKSRDLDTLEKIIARYNCEEEFRKRELALYRQKSGLDLALEVQASKPDLVIDFGCGGNLFKDYIDNLIGIDITPHPKVDIVDDIHNALNYFKPKSADWIFNFGVYQFQSNDGEKQTEIMSELIKDNGTIVAHCNRIAPGTLSIHDSEEYIKLLGAQYGLKTTEIDWSYTDTTKMTPEHLKIQKEVAKWSEFEMKDLISPRLTWRWNK